MNKRAFGILLFAGGIILGIFSGGLFRDGGDDGRTSTAGGASTDREILYWWDPMMPAYRSDKPGKSPMGMDLVPVYANAAAGGSGSDQSTVTISPAVVNNLGVRTAKVTTGNLWRKIETVGYVDLDETKISHVHVRTEGWIHDLKANVVGEPIAPGELLFMLYSPLLVNAQEEFLQVLAGKNQRLIDASAGRLDALGMTQRQIEQLRQRRQAEQYVGIYAPQSGIVYQLNVRHGMYVRPEDEVMALAELDTVWLLAEVFERQAAWVKIGQTAEARLPSMPGEVWSGSVEYIYPDLDPVTRTLRVRLKFANPDAALKPNMYAHVTLHGDAKPDALTIPREALIREAKEQRVILALGDGRFQARTVVAGMESGDQIEILSGLQAGDEVVVSAQFLLDSEASFKASMRRMEPLPVDQDAGPPPLPEQVPGVGTVQAVQADKRVINITHEPIDELDWPVMTMDFDVDAAIDITGFNTGDQVHFTLNPDASSHYVITAIEKQANTAPAATEIMAMGLVQAVHSEEHKLNITHDPIETLGWPGMTMDFKVAADVDLSEVKPGARIHFSLAKDAGGGYVITAI
ncbi:MAG: rane fusion protein, partial [Gammaproteobacteria bacterium]|nr:rane fusion protein [Gammaproteobacteria bacterium]